MTHSLSTLLLLVASVSLVPAEAHAYIDPGAGSYLVQVLVAGVMGAVMVARTHWQRIKAFFGAGPADDESVGASVPPERPDGK